MEILTWVVRHVFKFGDFVEKFGSTLMSFDDLRIIKGGCPLTYASRKMYYKVHYAQIRSTDLTCLLSAKMFSV